MTKDLNTLMNVMKAYTRDNEFKLRPRLQYQAEHHQQIPVYSD
jgi:hypothetical protein